LINGDSHRLGCTALQQNLQGTCGHQGPRLPTPEGPSLDNVDWWRIRRDFPWTAAPNFGSHSCHTGRSDNFQHCDDVGRTKRFVRSSGSYHPCLGAPGRLHDWRDGSGSDPSDPGAFQRLAGRLSSLHTRRCQHRPTISMGDEPYRRINGDVPPDPRFQSRSTYRLHLGTQTSCSTSAVSAKLMPFRPCSSKA
jgi:hypothetical protein